LNCYQQESCCNPTLKNVKYERNRVTPLVFGEIFLQPILLDW
jgi:hypothetical protein